MARPTNEVKEMATTIAMLRSQIKQEEIIAAKQRADLEHVRALNDRLIKENDWQRRLIQNLTEIAQRYFVR